VREWSLYYFCRTPVGGAFTHYVYRIRCNQSIKRTMIKTIDPLAGITFFVVVSTVVFSLRGRDASYVLDYFSMADLYPAVDTRDRQMSPQHQI